MKLYIYDHCPYCTKARMIFGYTNTEVEIITLLNDDEKTPHDLIGQKMVPILEFDNGEAIGESLDIIAKINTDSGKDSLSTQVSDASAFNTWLTESRDYLYQLAMPRWVNSSLKEFETQSAKNYFIKKKEVYIGPFAKHLESTSVLLKKAHTHLDKLDSFINEIGQKPSLLHINLYATLRCLTIVKEISFPKNVLKFMKEQEASSKVDFHIGI